MLHVSHVIVFRCVTCNNSLPLQKQQNSGLAVKKMIDCGAGVVDADYRGPVGVVLFNFGSDDFEVNVGDRIAQLILEQISMVPAVKVEELTETQRGAGGFGSTGVEKALPEEKTDAKKQRTISPSNSGEAPMEP